MKYLKKKNSWDILFVKIYISLVLSLENLRTYHGILAPRLISCSIIEPITSVVATPVVVLGIEQSVRVCSCGSILVQSGEIFTVDNSTVRCCWVHVYCFSFYQFLLSYVSACDPNISLKFVLPSTSKRANFLKRKWKLLLFIGCGSRKTKLFFWFGNVKGESEMNMIIQAWV